MRTTCSAVLFLHETWQEPFQHQQKTKFQVQHSKALLGFEQDKVAAARQLPNLYHQHCLGTKESTYKGAMKALGFCG